jgi:hypothetical protein
MARRNPSVKTWLMLGGGTLAAAGVTYLLFRSSSAQAAGLTTGGRGVGVSAETAAMLTQRAANPIVIEANGTQRQVTAAEAASLEASGQYQFNALRTVLTAKSRLQKTTAGSRSSGRGMGVRR